MSSLMLGIKTHLIVMSVARMNPGIFSNAETKDSRDAGFFRQAVYASIIGAGTRFDDEFGSQTKITLFGRLSDGGN